jgi:hypothetical protein
MKFPSLSSSALRQPAMAEALEAIFAEVVELADTPS